MEKTKERRKHHRFPAQDGALVFTPLIRYLGQVIDISLGGLTFSYVAPVNELNEPCILTEDIDKLDIVFGRKNFLLSNIPIQTVADFKIETFTSHNQVVMKRRHSVRFGKLSADQLFRLKRFILTMTKEKVAQSFLQKVARQVNDPTFQAI